MKEQITQEKFVKDYQQQTTGEADINLNSVFDLSPPEKLQLVEDLWDDLAASPEAAPVYDWQKKELLRRKANLMNNPDSGLSWEAVKRRIRHRHGR